MPKASINERNKRNKEFFLKYKDLRNQYKVDQKKIRNNLIPASKTMYYSIMLDRLPRRASATRHRNMCRITGRSRGMVHYKRFGMCGYQIREKASIGRILSLVKI